MKAKRKREPVENLNLDAYRFTVRSLSEDEGGGFLIEYPDVPGCISDGETPAQAIANGRDALKSTLLTFAEFSTSEAAKSIGGTLALPRNVRQSAVGDARHRIFPVGNTKLRSVQNR